MFHRVQISKIILTDFCQWVSRLFTVFCHCRQTGISILVCMDISIGYMSRSQITSISKNTHTKIMCILPNSPERAVRGANGTSSRNSYLGLHQLWTPSVSGNCDGEEKLASSSSFTSNQNLAFPLIISDDHHSIGSHYDFVDNRNHKYFRCCCQYLELLFILFTTLKFWWL